MAERLVNMFFTGQSMEKFAGIISANYPAFARDRFLSLVYTDNWDKKELKEKMRHTTLCLRQVLPDSFPEAVEVLIAAAPLVKGFEAMVLPDYVELYGLDHWEKSMQALEVFTQYSSSEFAIRPFIIQDPAGAMTYMNKFAESANPKVRRFSSEGCRPRLPWAMAIPAFKKDPSLILPLLEKLKDDVSESVRRSVANNLNDISKDHPDIVLDLCESWAGDSARTGEIIKRACRGLLKAGDKRALVLFGFSNPGLLQVESIGADRSVVTIGDEIFYSFDLIVHDQTCKVRLEYSVFFVKSGGKTSKKIFQIIEKEFEPGRYRIKRKHSFADQSTRKHYPGVHRFEFIANGEVKGEFLIGVNER
ncbi:DNA alkylation repair protein [candidate division KSB1 bacterium]|nr:DNA alkylation repair protein [candidate division KSB1 bacterium]